MVTDSEQGKFLAQLHPGSILKINGTALASAQAPQGVEIVDPAIEVEVAIREAPMLEYYKPEILTDLEHILDHPQESQDPGRF